MNRNPEFVSRQVADRFVIVPVGTAAEKFSGMITINATGKFLWERLEKGAELQELVKALCAEFEVEEDRAKAGVSAFVENLKSHGFLED